MISHAPSLPLSTALSSSLARSLKLYNNLVERCFRDCVQDFRGKSLDSGEEKVRCSAAAVDCPQQHH